MPGHTGVIGNEIADCIAKQAVVDTDLIVHDLGLDIRNFTREHYRTTNLRKWQEEWDSSTTGSLTHGLIKQVNAGQTVYSPVINRLLSGHFPCNSYLFRFKLRDNDNCSICKKCETIKHILCECPAYSNNRMKHLNTITNPNLENVITNKIYIEEILKKREHIIRYGNLV